MKRILQSILLVAALVAARPAFALGAFTNAAVTNSAVLVSSTPATLTFINVANANASIVYVQVFNASAANQVTVGTTAPVFWFPVTTSNPINQELHLGYTFSKGIVIAVTTTPTGGTAPGTACPVVLFTAI
jgi:hypothetical protein